MSRNRSSRPSFSSSTRRTYGSSGRLGRARRTAGRSSSGGSSGRRRHRTGRRRAACRAARPPRPSARPRRRRRPSGRASRSVRAQIVARADDRRPDEQRTQVARDGLDLGQLRHGRGLRRERSDRRLERQLVGLGGDRVLARQRRHRLPVVADLHVDRRAARTGAARPPSSRARPRPARRPRRAASRTAARRGR